MSIKMKRLQRYRYGNAYTIHVLDNKTIQNGIFPLGDTWFHSQTYIVMSQALSNAENVHKCMN